MVLESTIRKTEIIEENVSELKKKETIQLLNQVRFTSEVIHRVFNFQEEFKIYEEIVQIASEKIQNQKIDPILEYVIPSHEIFFLDQIYSQQNKGKVMDLYSQSNQNKKIRDMTTELNRTIRYKALNQLNNYIQQSNISIYADFNQAVMAQIQQYQNINNNYSQSLTGLTSGIQEFIFLAGQQEYSTTQNKLVEDHFEICQELMEQVSQQLKRLIDIFKEDQSNIVKETLDKVSSMIIRLIETIISEINHIRGLRTAPLGYQEHIETISRISNNAQEDQQTIILEQLTDITYLKLIVQIKIQNSSQLFYSFIIPTFKQIQAVSDTMINMMIKQKMQESLEAGYGLLPQNINQYNDIMIGIKELNQLGAGIKGTKYNDIHFDIETIE